MKNITTTIKNCARCEMTHINLEFVPFHRTGVNIENDTYTHWAMCPFKDEPILLMYWEKDNKKKLRDG